MKISEQAKKDGVKFVSLQITDLLGVVKEIIIPVEELENTLKRHGSYVIFTEQMENLLQEIPDLFLRK